MQDTPSLASPASLGSGTQQGSVYICGVTRVHTHLQEQPHHLGLAVQRGLVERRACFGLAVDLNPGSQELPADRRASDWRGGQQVRKERKLIAGGWESNPEQG